MRVGLAVMILVLVVPSPQSPKTCRSDSPAVERAVNALRMLNSAQASHRARAGSFASSLKPLMTGWQRYSSEESQWGDAYRHVLSSQEPEAAYPLSMRVSESGYTAIVKVADESCGFVALTTEAGVVYRAYPIEYAVTAVERK